MKEPRDHGFTTVTDEEIKVGNRLIAEYDEYPTMFPRTNFRDNTTTEVEMLPNYHTDMRLLMNVVEKVQRRSNHAVEMWLDSGGKGCVIFKGSSRDDMTDVIAFNEMGSLMEAVWVTLVAFLRWVKCSEEPGISNVQKN